MMEETLLEYVATGGPIATSMQSSFMHGSSSKKKIIVSSSFGHSISSSAFVPDPNKVQLDEVLSKIFPPRVTKHENTDFETVSVISTKEPDKDSVERLSKKLEAKLKERHAR